VTSTPSILLTKRSGQSSDRPSGTVVQGGELAISRGASDPGLYFEDTAGDIRKIGPSHYGTTAPNSTPAGLPGNSVGETWTDVAAIDTALPGSAQQGTLFYQTTVPSGLYIYTVAGWAQV
jgi:hypothetical protein